jgi:hypothetical protein
VVRLQLVPMGPAAAMTVRRDGRGRNAQWDVWVPPEPMPMPTERRQEQLRRRAWLAERSKADE